MGNIIFTVPGPPVPKARARIVKGRAYTPAQTVAYETKVKALALLARQNARQRRWTGPVCLDVIFYVKNPEGKPDISNLVKAIEDACIGVIYEDDAQITHLWARKKGLVGDEDHERPEAAIVTFSKARQDCLGCWS